MYLISRISCALAVVPDMCLMALSSGNGELVRRLFVFPVSSTPPSQRVTSWAAPTSKGGPCEYSNRSRRARDGRGPAGGRSGSAGTSRIRPDNILALSGQCPLDVECDWQCLARLCVRLRRPVPAAGRNVGVQEQERLRRDRVLDLRRLLDRARALGS